MFNPFKSSRHPISATGLLTPQEFDSPSKVFMKVGKSFYEMILKTCIPNKRVADALASLYSQYAEFGIDKEDGPQMKHLWALTATWAAIGGRASIMALEGMTQVVSERLTLSASGLPVDGVKPEEERGRSGSHDNNTTVQDREAPR